MVNISKLGDSSIKFTFTDNDRYLYNGEITVPLNSLILLLDESDMAVFKKIDGDLFVSFLISNSNFSSKSELETFYKDNMVGSTGGGSGSGITSGEVQTMIDESISGKADVSAATIVNQTSGTVTSAKTTTHGGESITLNFAYNDGVTSFSGGCIGMVAFDNPRTPFVKYTTIDGVVKNAERGSDTDEYNYQNVSRKVVITMKGDNRLTYIEMGYEDPVTINYTYDYVTNQSVAASTYIEDTINPKLEELEARIKALEEQNNT